MLTPQLGEVLLLHRGQLRRGRAVNAPDTILLHDSGLCSSHTACVPFAALIHCPLLATVIFPFWPCAHHPGTGSPGADPPVA